MYAINEYTSQCGEYYDSTPLGWRSVSKELEELDLIIKTPQ
jgi:hypothetical protein